MHAKSSQRLGHSGLSRHALPNEAFGARLEVELDLVVHLIARSLTPKERKPEEALESTFRRSHA
jgi:hypothetical protein